MSLIAFIGSFLRLQRGSFLLIGLLSLAWSIDSAVWPYIIGRIVDILTQNESHRTQVWAELRWLLPVGVFLWVLIECCFRYRGFLSARAFPQLQADIRMAMFDHIQHHSPRYFNEHFAGSLTNKISDMTTQVTSLIHKTTVFLPALASSFLILAFFSQVHPLFAWILALWIVAHVSITFFFTKKCVEYAHQHGESRSQLAGKIVDSLTNNFAVNLFARFPFEKERIALSQKEEKEKNMQALRYTSWMLVALSSLFVVAITALNAFLILYWIEEKISTGEVVQVIYTAFNVCMILWFASNLLPEFYQSIGTAKQALSVMHDPQDTVDLPGTPSLLISKGEIVFENVSFHYGDKKLFQNKDVHIRGGEKVGLVGYSGAGKSTFVNLILRFFPLEKGRILIDGQDISRVTLESLRQQISLIPQDPLLFHRTLEENIQYGNIHASKEHVYQAAKWAHCDEFIQKRPKGYATVVGERGTKLSGGERQRIVIARALLADSSILILDEATSSLDSLTEQFIQEGLETLMQSRTTLVVAHRLSTLSKMNRILVFDQGKIVEEGPHEELMKHQGYYARMWNMQVGGFLPNNPKS